MSKLSKRFLSMLVAAVMVLSMVPASVFASDYNVSDMTDEEVAALAVQLEAEGDYDALEDIYNQLVAAGRVEDVEALMSDNDYAVGTIAENTATVTAYKQVDYVTSKVVDAKYFELVKTAADLEEAVKLISGTGATGGLIEISEGTLVVTNRQDITMANIIIKGAGKDLTTITGDSSKFNNSTNGLASSSLSSEYKAILGLSSENIKVMDLTVDGGDCGVATGGKIPYTNVFVQTGWADFKTVRINSGVSYLQNVNINGTKTRANLMIGTSETTSVVHANGLNVAKRSGYSSTSTEIASGSTLNTMNSMLGGSVVGSVENLGEGYYKVEYAGVVAYTTIPYAIECYENGTFSSSMLNSTLVDSGVTVVEAMTNDLTTITTGAPKLLYGYNCAEMRQLAAEFKAALLGLSSSAEVDATVYLAQLTKALATEQWHTVEADGTCSVCKATGLEVPTPEIEVEIPSVEDILPEDVTEEEKEVIESVVEEIEQNTSLEGFVPENLAEGSTLSIKLTAVDVSTGETSAPEKITYDVKPVDSTGNVTAPTGTVTFRLPIPASVTKPLASVYHEDTLMGTYPIQGSGNGKYVEVTTSSFSTFAVEPEEAPDATVTVMDPMMLTPGGHDYMCWPSGDATIDRPLQIVMNFKANETLEECVAGKFSKYLVDFYLKVEGLSNGTITTDGCYLAGNYGTFGWVVIPADGIEMEEGVYYPIVSAYDATLNYKDICGSVKDFTAAIYISEAILTANPDFKVTLELRMTNPNDSTNVLVVGEPATYTVADLNAGMEYLGDCQEVSGNIANVNTNTTIDSNKHADEIQAAKDTLRSIGFTAEEVENATTEVVISFVEMDYVEDNAPAKIVYTVTPMVKVGTYEQKISTFDEPVTFRLPVSAAETCDVAKVYHEDELMGVYTIKEENGVKYVEVSSKTFSAYTVEPVSEYDAVAKVGDTYYATLQAAVDAANGATVTLLTDVTTDMVEIAAGTTVTLDLAGYDLTTTADGYALDVYGKLILTGTADSVVTGGICINDANSEVVMDTVTVQTLSTERNGMYNVLNYGGKFTMNSGKLYVAYDADSVLIALWSYGGTTVINGGEIISDDTYNKAGDDAVYAILATNSANVTISNATVTGAGGAVCANGGATVTVNGGTFTSGLFHAAYGGTGAVVINAGNFYGSLDSNVTVMGGTFSTDVSDYVADGYELNDNGNGTYSVAADPTYGMVAKIGDTYYATLQAAVDAANGATVTLLTDVSITASVQITADTVIDLNGCTISASTHAFRVQGVDLTLKNGTLDVTTVAAAVVSAGNGTDKNVIVIDKMTINSQWFGVYHNGSSYGADVTITNSTITDTLADGVGVFLSGSDAWGADKMNNLVITGSTITGATAVEGKHTNITVENSTLATNASAQAFINSTNGSCSVGYAIALTNNTTDTANAATVGSIKLEGTNTLNGGVSIKAEDAVSVTTNAPDLITAPEGYEWVNGVLTAIEEEPAGTITSNGKTLSFEEMVFVNQYLVFAGFADEYLTREYIEANGGMEVIYEDGRSYVVGVVMNGYYQGVLEYRAQTQGIAAKMFTDELTFRPFLTINGERIYGDDIYYGVQVYAENIIKKSTNEYYKVAMAAMLNYGAAAQDRFGYNLDDYANANLQTLVDEGYLTDEQILMNWTEDLLTPVIEVSDEMAVNFAQSGSITHKDKALNYEGLITVKYYIGVGDDPAAFENAKNAKLYFWTAARYNELLEKGEALTKENASDIKDATLTNGGAEYGYEYVATSEGVISKEYSNTLYACLYVEDADGNVHCSGVIAYSPEQYAANKLNNDKVDKDDNVAQWMVVYGERIKEYLKNK